jgi:predicted TIM-barrel fold metal-dependent hydrolase
MKANGVDKTVIVHVIYYRWDCRYAGDVIKANQKQFMGVCRINPEADSAADHLKRWVGDYGFHGVRLSPEADETGEWINDRHRMDRIFKRAAELKIPLCILCPSARLPDVGRVIERHKEVLDVCIDHMADCAIDRPDEWKKLLALAKYPRVFVRISHLWSLSQQKYPYKDTHEQVKRLYDAFGPKRLMWGRSTNASRGGSNSPYNSLSGRPHNGDRSVSLHLPGALPRIVDVFRPVSTRIGEISVT